MYIQVSPLSPVTLMTDYLGTDGRSLKRHGWAARREWLD